MRISRLAPALPAFFCLLLAGCGGKSTDPTSSSYSVGGKASGISGGSVVLSNNGIDTLTVGANGSFTFAKKLPYGQSYRVAITSNPAGEICSLGGTAKGVIVGQVIDITVACSATSATVSTWAGDLTPGSADGPGIGARFNFPVDIASDAAGNLYVSDSANRTIRKIAADGTVTTLAGTAGVIGAADGTGAAASFSLPTGIAADASGNVYVVDTGNNTIRKITPAGVVTTVAGTAGVKGYANGTGTAATFDTPASVAVDTSGNLYVTDRGNSTIRKITPAGVVTTLAGTPGLKGALDGVGATAQFFFPIGIAVDASGNVYVGDGINTIRKITAGGTVTTLAGMPGFSGGADGTGPAAGFNGIGGIALDASGNIYVADQNNQAIRKVTPAGAVSMLAGISGTAGYANGNAGASSFNNPTGVAVDAAGNVYVADYNNHRIRKIAQ